MKYILAFYPLLCFILGAWVGYWKGRSDALKDWKQILMPFLKRIQILESMEAEERKESEPTVH